MKFKHILVLCTSLWATGGIAQSMMSSSEVDPAVDPVGKKFSCHTEYKCPSGKLISCKITADEPVHCYNSKNANPENMSAIGVFCVTATEEATDPKAARFCAKAGLAEPVSAFEAD